jgi:hypothetical protein
LQQKSRINWLASEDRNTKFFHAYASYIKQSNVISDIKKGDGSKITSQHALKKEAIGYFQNIFKTHENLSISNQLEVIRAYPRIFSDEKGLRIAHPVTISEVLSTLKGFVDSKIPGPDGWTIELFFCIF